MGSQVDPEQFTKPFLLTKAYHRDPYPAISPKNPANKQSDKIVIITGASGGIGEAAARVWAQAGAAGIVIAARRVEQLGKVSAELKKISPSTKVLAVATDISSEASVKNLYASIQKEFGRPADVLLNNAGYLEDDQLIGETPVEEWWIGVTVNLKGLYNMSHQFIQAQPNPKEPKGTLIAVASGRAGITNPGGSAYNISKLAEQRLNEHIQMEYPTLRVFTTMPGISLTTMITDYWRPFALDHNELTGMLSLYLAQERADYLKGGMVGVNWDVEELEKHKDEIVEKGLVKTSWMPSLPFNGGAGLTA